MLPTKIVSFAAVMVPQRALVVLDIDDTVMRFAELGRGWWRDREKELAAAYSSDVVRELVMREWIDGAHIYQPLLTDPDSFPQFLERLWAADAHLVFLTARHAELRKLTELHMSACGIEVETEQLIFARQKGGALKALVEAQGFKDVIFIDDMEHNLEDVGREVGAMAGVELQTFHFHKFAPAS